MKLFEAVGIAWFLWSTVYPGGSYRDSDIKAQPVKQFASHESCEKALPIYEKEIEKTYPRQKEGGFVFMPWVELKCSPVYPR